MNQILRSTLRALVTRLTPDTDELTDPFLDALCKIEGYVKSRETDLNPAINDFIGALVLNDNYPTVDDFDENQLIVFITDEDGKDVLQIAFNCSLGTNIISDDADINTLLSILSLITVGTGHLPISPEASLHYIYSSEKHAEHQLFIPTSTQDAMTMNGNTNLHLTCYGVRPLFYEKTQRDGLMRISLGCCEEHRIHYDYIKMDLNIFDFIMVRMILHEILSYNAHIDLYNTALDFITVGNFFPVLKS